MRASRMCDAASCAAGSLAVLRAAVAADRSRPARPRRPPRPAPTPQSTPALTIPVRRPPPSHPAAPPTTTPRRRPLPRAPPHRPPARAGAAVVLNPGHNGARPPPADVNRLVPSGSAVEGVRHHRHRDRRRLPRHAFNWRRGAGAGDPAAHGVRVVLDPAERQRRRSVRGRAGADRQPARGGGGRVDPRRRRRASAMGSTSARTAHSPAGDPQVSPASHRLARSSMTRWPRVRPGPGQLPGRPTATSRVRTWPG